MLAYSLESLRARTTCSGALFWMYNDCWGEVGWTIVDYYLRRKIAYYGVRRALAPRRLILRRQDDTVRVIACNDTALAISLTLQTGWTGFDGVGLKYSEHAVTLPAHSRGEILRFPLCGDLSRGVHFARPLPDEAIRYGLEPALLLWGEYRHLALCPPVVAISSARDDGPDQVIVVEAATFAHGVHIILPPEIEPSDAYFDLLPGERRTIRLPGAAGQPVDLRTVAVDLIENG
jgi:beta-mannosidase